MKYFEWGQLNWIVTTIDDLKKKYAYNFWKVLFLAMNGMLSFIRELQKKKFLQCTKSTDGAENLKWNQKETMEFYTISAIVKSISSH